MQCRLMIFELLTASKFLISVRRRIRFESRRLRMRSEVLSALTVRVIIMNSTFDGA